MERLCAYCQGEGLIGSVACPACGGRGKVSVPETSGKCPCCSGFGVAGCCRCSVCRGTGWEGAD
jgi:hypothetical protein